MKKLFILNLMIIILSFMSCSTADKLQTESTSGNTVSTEPTVGSVLPTEPTIGSTLPTEPVGSSSTLPNVTTSGLPPVNDTALNLAKNAVIRKTFSEVVSTMSDNINLSDLFDGTIDDGFEYNLPWKYTDLINNEQTTMATFLYNAYFITMFTDFVLTPCDTIDEETLITVKCNFYPDDERKPYKLTIYVSASCVWFDYNDISFSQRYLIYTSDNIFLIKLLNGFMIGYKFNEEGQRLTVW